MNGSRKYSYCAMSFVKRNSSYTFHNFDSILIALNWSKSELDNLVANSGSFSEIWYSTFSCLITFQYDTRKLQDGDHNFISAYFFQLCISNRSLSQWFHVYINILISPGKHQLHALVPQKTFARRSPALDIDLGDLRLHHTICSNTCLNAPDNSMSQNCADNSLHHVNFAIYIRQPKL